MKKTIIGPLGEEITVEEIMTFKVEELNKTFLAYTVNDDGISPNALVNLVEVIGIDTDKPAVSKITDQEVPIVTEVFTRLLEDV